VYYCIFVFMVSSLIYFCYIIGYPRYLCAFIYYISALISCENNPDQWYQSRLLLIVFQCMSPTRSEYSKLGLDLVSLEDNRSRTPKKPSMEEEKKNDGADDPINLLLEQALTRQRDEMMENFSHILQRLPIASGASSSRNHFGGTSPFKVQVNFDIPIFEGQIDADALDKWLNLLEGYFSVHNFSDKEKITFCTP
jgi:hypothetical protein